MNNVYEDARCAEARRHEDSLVNADYAQLEQRVEAQEAKTLFVTDLKQEQARKERARYLYHYTSVDMDRTKWCAGVAGAVLGVIGWEAVKLVLGML